MSKRRRTSGGRKAAEAKFWGSVPTVREGEDVPVAAAVVRPTPEPGALVRSLGVPPLAVDVAVAERHLTAVYEEAVRAATALAAANGMLEVGGDDG
ncbi:MAG: hypothetical protein M0Z42_17735 [Actinomycetota bacterium]|jgi:hypothetical protein|nr:hypothetical protein [Actinomycetota bacterium]